MKKVILIILVATISILSSCSKIDDNVKEIAGFWQCSKWEEKIGGHNLLSNIDGGWTIIFSEDNTCIETKNKFPSFNTFAFSEDGSRFYLGDEEYLVISFGAGVLDLTNEDEFLSFRR